MYRTIPEQIVEELRKEIYSGQLAEGEQLREQELSERFGVSRGPVRHALLQLTKEGLLVSKANVGVKVAQHPSEDVENLIISLRRQIELFALDSVFNLLREKHLEELEGILDNLRESCEKDDIESVEEYDLAIHSLIIGLHGDHHLLDLWQSVVTRMMLRYTRYKDLIESYREHEEILEAIKGGDKKKAKKLLELNIQ